MRHRSRWQYGRGLTLTAGLVLSLSGAALSGSAVAAEPVHAKVVRGQDQLRVEVAGAPGYTLDIATDQLRLTTARAGRTVLATTADQAGSLRFTVAGSWHRATRVTEQTWRDGALTLVADTSLPGASVHATVTPEADRYALTWSVRGTATPATRLTLAYDLASAGHWYGHGETRTDRKGPHVHQPWPLETGSVHDPEFGPASYFVVDPFWFTSTATGLYVHTGQTMDVGINAAKDGLGRFTLVPGGEYRSTVFVADTPLEVYRDYVGIVGKPAKSDATYRQYAGVMWNSWAQFYTRVDQASFLAYAERLHRAGLTDHTLQLDDRWESNYGNLTFDPKTFPRPRAMSDRVHALGMDLGLWTTLWINHDSANYAEAAARGYLLASQGDRAKPCQVTWWNGKAGIIDLGNPEARDWYVGRLRNLMKEYRVDGFKFDTRFFDERCAPRPGLDQADYQRLGVELADGFDLQGLGTRVHWTPEAHRVGFATRQVDKGTGWDSLAAAVTQNLAISTLGYPFVETDMTGGSLLQPAPTKEVLVRWAQAAALTPLQNASSSPVEGRDPKTGKPVTYDRETVELYRAALQRHRRLAPYLWTQVRHAVATGDPIMRPLFFDFPTDQRGYTVTDQWMLGPALLAAPVLTAGDRREVFLPAGRWYDAQRRTVVTGPTTLRDYPAPLASAPVFVRLGAPGAGQVIEALTRPAAD